MNKSYKFSSEGTKNQISRNIPFVIFLLVVCIAVGFIQGYRGMSSDFNSWFVTIPGFAIILGIAIRKAIKRQRDILNSIEINISENSINKSQKGFPLQIIQQNEIVSMIEYTGKGIMIKTQDKTKSIFIPFQINEFAEIKDVISGWHPIEPAKGNTNYRLINLMSGLLTICAMVVVYVSHNKFVILSVGLLLALSLIFSLLFIQLSKQIDAQTKKSSWLILLPIFAVIYKMWLFQ